MKRFSRMLTFSLVLSLAGRIHSRVDGAEKHSGWLDSRVSDEG